MRFLGNNKLENINTTLSLISCKNKKNERLESLKKKKNHIQKKHSNGANEITYLIIKQQIQLIFFLN